MPSISPTARHNVAVRFSADIVVHPWREDAVAMVQDLTGKRGVDVAKETVDTPETGRIENIGVHASMRTSPSTGSTPTECDVQ